MLFRYVKSPPPPHIHARLYVHTNLMLIILPSIYFFISTILNFGKNGFRKTKCNF